MSQQQILCLLLYSLLKMIFYYMRSHNVTRIVDGSIVLVEEHLELFTLVYSQVSHIIQLTDNLLFALSFTFEQVYYFLKIWLRKFKELLLEAERQRPVLRASLLNCIKTCQLLVIVLFLFDVLHSSVVSLHVSLVEHTADNSIESIMKLD